MSLAEMLLPEFDDEMGKTRRVLERVPADRFDWQPHAKSMSLIRLAGHLAFLPAWGLRILNGDSFDIAPTGGQPPQRTPPASVAALLEEHDKNVATARLALAGSSDADLQQPWELRRGEQVIYRQPRLAMFRTMLMNHIIHHRGQLTVYLRLNDVPLPPLFGPTADEGI